MLFVLDTPPEFRVLRVLPSPQSVFASVLLLRRSLPCRDHVAPAGGGEVIEDENEISDSILAVLLRLSADSVSERFTPPAEIVTAAENGQFQRVRRNVARMAFVLVAIGRLNVHTLKTNRRRCR